MWSQWRRCAARVELDACAAAICPDAFPDCQCWDVYEPDDDEDEAALIAAGRYDDTPLCDDVDWYRLEGERARELAIEAHIFGDWLEDKGEPILFGMPDQNDAAHAAETRGVFAASEQAVFGIGQTGQRQEEYDLNITERVLELCLPDRGSYVLIVDGFGANSAGTTAVELDFVPD